MDRIWSAWSLYFKLKPYGQYWFVTITPYGKDIEPNVPEKEKVVNDFKRLSDIVGVDSVGWRYDPIFINDTYSAERHLEAFEKMAAALSGYTKSCIISFIDIYKKVERSFPEARAVSKKKTGAFSKILCRCNVRCGETKNRLYFLDRSYAAYT